AQWIAYVQSQLYGAQFRYPNGTVPNPPASVVASVAAAAAKLDKVFDDAIKALHPTTSPAVSGLSIPAAAVCSATTTTATTTVTMSTPPVRSCLQCKSTNILSYPYKCSKCSGKVFCTPSCLVDHARSHPSTTTTAVASKCPSCKGFSTEPFTGKCLVPSCGLLFCTQYCLLRHRGTVHSATSSLPVPALTSTAVSSSTFDATLTPLFTRIALKSSTCTDILAVWKTSNTNSASLYNKIPSPHSFSIRMDKSMMETVFAFSSAGTLVVRDGVVVYWHFGATGGNGALPYASCEGWFCGGSSKVMLGGISEGVEKLDITQGFRTTASTFQRIYNASTNPTTTISFTVNFTYKVTIQSIQTAIVVHKKLSASESVAKLYQGILTSQGDAQQKPESTISTTTGSLVLAPKIPRDLGELQKEVVKICLASSSSTCETKKADEDDVCVGDSTITFSCPLSLIRIRHPAKGKHCKHKQVFDAETFLSFNEKKEMWKCVICNQKIEQSDLTIDTEMLRLLEKYAKFDKCIIKSNGEDEPFSEAPIPTVNTTTTTNNTLLNPRTAFLIDDDDDGAGVHRRHSAPGGLGGEGGGVKGGGAPKRRISEVICLDSDDDEDIPIAKAVRLATAGGAAEYSPNNKPVSFTTVQVLGEGGKVVETIVID
ncbi:UNVERIFIED_CONTAM: hypothetical protein HDU68_004351, partial [Siphonaria sp. JEL0065]